MALIDWKSIFTLFLIILLGWYLFVGQSGSNGNFLSSLQSKLSGILSTFKLPDILGTISNQNVQTGNTTMYLSVQSDIFNSQQLDVTNSVLSGFGSCDLNVTSNNLPIVSQGVQNMSVGIMSGKVSFSNDGKMDISGTSSGLQLGVNSIPGGSSGFPISISCQSTGFTLTNILENKIVLSGASGTLAGTKGSRALANDSLEVDGFSGSLQFVGSLANLNGTIRTILLNGNDANIILQ